MVDFIEGCIDEGAQELNVSGVRGIERISQNQMRITYFVRRRGEATVVVHLVWDREDWLRQWLYWERMREDISSHLFELEPAAGDGSPKDVH